MSNSAHRSGPAPACSTPNMRAPPKVTRGGARVMRKSYSHTTQQPESGTGPLRGQESRFRLALADEGRLPS